MIARWIALVALAVALAPAILAHAQGEPTYQTVNGVETLSSMARQLQAAGYGGPWEAQSVINAYARTTGAEVTAIARDAPPTPVPAAQPQTQTRRTIIVLVGGLGSELDSANWAGLKGTLETGWGYSDTDIFLFSYDGWSVPAGSSTMTLNWYAPGETCAPLANSEDLLAGMLRFLRDSRWSDRVILVGHSLGGVVALDVAANALDLSPYLSKVVTIDSPLGGVGELGALGLDIAWGVNGKVCQAGHDLQFRNAQRVAWQNTLTARVKGAQSRGIQLMIVTNPGDGLMSEFQQRVLLPNVDWSLNAQGHSAVLYDANHVLTIAQWIGPQGQ